MPPIYMTQAQIDLIKKIHAFASQLDANEHLRGNPAAIDIARILIDAAAEMAIPRVVYESLRTCVAEYDNVESLPVHRRPLWFQPRDDLKSVIE